MAPDTDTVFHLAAVVSGQAEADFDPIPFDSRAARAFGRVAADLRAAGRKTKARAYDALIAAIAGSSGDVLLEATVGDVVLNADVESTTGHITVTAGDDVAQNADISTGTLGTVLVTAANGTVDGLFGIDMAADYPPAP